MCVVHIIMDKVVTTSSPVKLCFIRSRSISFCCCFACNHLNKIVEKCPNIVGIVIQSIITLLIYYSTICKNHFATSWASLEVASKFWPILLTLEYYFR